jgi:hypothetical protein
MICVSSYHDCCVKSGVIDGILTEAAIQTHAAKVKPSAVPWSKDKISGMRRRRCKLTAISEFAWKQLIDPATPDLSGGSGVPPISAGMCIKKKPVFNVRWRSKNLIIKLWI